MTEKNLKSSLAGTDFRLFQFVGFAVDRKCAYFSNKYVVFFMVFEITQN